MNKVKSALFNILSLSQRQIAFLGPLEWRNLFGPKDKVSSYQKLVFRSAVRFLFLFVLMDDILLNLDLQKRTRELINFLTLQFCLSLTHNISKNWRPIFLKFKIDFTRCGMKFHNQYHFEFHDSELRSRSWFHAFHKGLRSSKTLDFLR